MNRRGVVKGGRGHFPFPAAVQHVRKLGGDSQPSIVLTTGCKFYVVKCRDFTGCYGLMKEVIGTELMSRITLPVPQWTPVLLTDEFIDSNPRLWWQGETGLTGIWEKRRPQPGLHFGSQLTRSDNECQTYSMIPPDWAPRVVNLDDFVGALLIALWTNNCDRLQCVFTTHDSGATFRAVFIDHGHMFGGFDGTMKLRPEGLLRAHGELCRTAWNEEAVIRWRERVMSLDDRVVDAVLEEVPSEWAGSQGISLVRTQLVKRRERLDSLIVQMGSTLAAWTRPLRPRSHPVPVAGA